MKKILKKGLSLALALIMVAGLLPLTAFAAVDSSGKPTDLKNTLVLSIYTPEGSFPGEPATHGSEDYISFNSSFKKTSASGQFKSSAVGELKTNVLDDLVQGASNGNNTVWGVFSAEGLKEKYFESDATIIQPKNEAAIIRAVKGLSNSVSDADVLDQYEIIWYVIKLQHSPGSWFWSQGTTEWHIDGVVRERSKDLISINYYGNGNTEGAAPDGVTNHVEGDAYTVLGSTKMKKKINGVYVDFLGWSAKADGTGDEAGFYQPGDVIYPTESISLYAMWDTFTQYTATVKTYLDGVLTDSEDIHEHAKDLHLSTDEEHYYQLTRDSEGVYTVKITGNGKFHLYHKNEGGSYSQIGTHQLTIYNQNGSLEVHHYSVTYDPNGGDFPENPGKQAYMDEEAVNAVAAIPTKEGYRFLGWKDDSGKLIQPGEEITAAIDKPITLTAQWEKTVSVTINVTVKHEGGGGLDKVETKDNVSLALVSRENDQSPYLEVEGKTLELDNGIVPAEQKLTKYTGYTYTDMPGGEVDYTVVTSKSGYDTEVTAKQDAEGNWTIDVEMIFNPNDFDLEFTVKVDKTVPAQHIPTAAIVKVTFWSNADDEWQLITQQDGNLPGVRVDIDPDALGGSGKYPVWKYESNGKIPYGYRIRVTSFVYPDGTIVRASDIEGENIEWTDSVYTATMDDVVGGKQFVTLDGAYYDEGDDSQKGTLNAVITMDLYNVTFDAQGGKVNGNGVQTVKEQYKIPGFKDYIPTREGGYLFDGWYLDKACTKKAAEGTDLNTENTLDGNITLYAKWIEPLTISGTVTISGTYLQNGETVSVHDIDRATEAVVVLQEIYSGSVYDVDSTDIFFGDYEDTGSADYSFTAIPNDGKQYQIHVLLLNYGTDYDNESDSNSEYTSSEYTAVFCGDNVADVDAYLEFEAPSYDQEMNVDATRISEEFRPTGVLSEVMYRDTGDNHPFHRISQHDVTPFGVNIALNTGEGSGSESIWKWHTNGALYDYQMNITKAFGNVQGVFSSEGTVFNSDTAPYYIIYDAPVYWDASAGKPSGEMKATLVPKQYLITFDLNAGTETVTGMDSYRIVETDEAGNSIVTDNYGTAHTWSFDTAITAVPQREGFIFKGWEANAKDVYDGSKIPAAVHQEVTLTAQWELITYEVTTFADPAEGGTMTGAGTYERGSDVTIEATPNNGYSFLGWYENGKEISTDAEYSFYVTGNRDLIAKFEQIAYQVTANAEHGGKAEGTASYHYGDTATVKATVDATFAFDGWYEGTEKVSDALEFTFTVTADRTLTAKFVKNGYQIEASPNNPDLGSATGSGYYDEDSDATVTAIAKEGNKFVGWFEAGTLVTTDASYTFTVKTSRVLFAHFAPAYTITANAQSGGSASGTGLYTSGDTVTIRAKANNGYYFVGWYDEKDEFVSSEADYTLPFKITGNRTFTAKFAARVSYKCDYVYLFGYNNSEIGATGPLLRGELAQMIYRLVKQNDESITNGGNSFSDTTGEWFESGVSYMAKVGAIDRNKANAYPFAPVTRGETYKMICLGLNFTTDTELSFSEYAMILRNSDYLTDDGRVTAKIQRWEFCELFNAILGRSGYPLIDTNDNEVTHETYKYTDLDPTEPYYKTMLIATSTFTNKKIDLVKRMERNTYDYNK